MMHDNSGSTRREFLAGAAVTVPSIALGSRALLSDDCPAAKPAERTWNLACVNTIRQATDRAVFDWTSLGKPGEDSMLMIAGRYADNCAAAYEREKYRAVLVLNARVSAAPAGLHDDIWSRYSLGTEYNIVDPATGSPALRNPFWARASQAADANGAAAIPTMQELTNRGALTLVCDFAIGHLATRLAPKMNRSADDIHQDLRTHLVPGGFLVPSGIFGLVKAQNAGCGFVRI